MENIKLPCSDEAVQAKTGRSWDQWTELLDERHGADLNHKALAELVESLHDAGFWWSQTVAIGYEQLKGKRQANQKSDGSFAASASKTIGASAMDVHKAFTDEDQRNHWLDGPITVRSATAPKSARLVWPDGSVAAVWIVSKAESKAAVSIDHGPLGDQQAVKEIKTYWKAALERLSKLLS